MNKVWTVSGLAFAVLLGGCGVLSRFSMQQPNYPSQVDWSKQGASPQETAAARSDCFGQARSATDRDTNITNDIMATGHNTWSNTGPRPVGTQTEYVATAAGGQLFDTEAQNVNNSVVKDCMIGKGFAPSN
jgi:hypothetical protein